MSKYLELTRRFEVEVGTGNGRSKTQENANGHYFCDYGNHSLLSFRNESLCLALVPGLHSLRLPLRRPHGSLGDCRGCDLTLTLSNWMENSAFWITPYHTADLLIQFTGI